MVLKQETQQHCIQCDQIKQEYSLVLNMMVYVLHVKSSSNRVYTERLLTNTLFYGSIDLYMMFQHVIPYMSIFL